MRSTLPLEGLDSMYAAAVSRLELPPPGGSRIDAGRLWEAFAPSTGAVIVNKISLVWRSLSTEAMMARALQRRAGVQRSAITLARGIRETPRTPIKIGPSSQHTRPNQMQNSSRVCHTCSLA